MTRRKKAYVTPDINAEAWSDHNATARRSTGMMRLARLAWRLHIRLLFFSRGLNNHAQIDIRRAWLRKRDEYGVTPWWRAGARSQNETADAAQKSE